MIDDVKVTGVDFATVFVKDYETAKAFYGGLLGLECSVDYGKIPGGEFETGNLTLQVMDAEAVGRQFQPSTHPFAFHVEDVEATRTELESAGVKSSGRRSTAASATWRSSAIPTATP
jgi:predicted enzyme related to lactoylglutathione lyase